MTVPHKPAPGNSPGGLPLFCTSWKKHIAPDALFKNAWIASSFGNYSISFQNTGQACLLSTGTKIMSPSKKRGGSLPAVLQETWGSPAVTQTHWACYVHPGPRMPPLALGGQGTEAKACCWQAAHRARITGKSHAFRQNPQTSLVAG